MISGCNPCKTEPILIYASKDLKAIGTFKSGTLWVYQNDSTLVLDSIVVTGFQDTPDTVMEFCQDDSVPLNYRESILTFTHSFLFDEDYILTVKVGAPVLLSKENLSADTIFIDAPCADSSYCNVIDTFLLNGNSFLQVYERIDSSSSLENGRLTHFYSAPNYGIIKKQIYNADSTIESWSLVYNKILQ